MPTDRNDLQIVIEAVNRASKDLKQIEKDLKGLSEGAEQAGKASKGMGADALIAAMGFKGMATAIATGTVAATAAIGAIKLTTKALTGMMGALKDATIYASRVNEVGIAMHVVANNAGIAASAIDKVRDAVVEENITTEAANTLLTRLIQNQLDYTRATELAAAAQNLAVVSGKDSSETLEMITHAISSGYPYILKMMGLTKHQSEIYEEYGASIGKAGDKLDETERKQAVMNYVLEEGERFAGAYTKAMDNAYKKLGSMGRVAKELAYNVGQTMEPALKAAVDAIYELGESVVDWFKINQGRIKAIAQELGTAVREVIATTKAFFERNKDVIKALAQVAIAVATRLVASLRVVTNALQIIGNAIELQVRNVATVGHVLAAAFRGDVKGIVEAAQRGNEEVQTIGKGMLHNVKDIGKAMMMPYQEYARDFESWFEGIEDVNSKWIDDMSNVATAGKALTAEQIKQLQKLADENEKYARAVEKKNKAFIKQLNDLVIAHRDAYKSLEKDIQEETIAFDKAMRDKEKAHEKTMRAMTEKHKEKTASILKDIEEERKAAQDEVDDINEEWNDLIELTGNAGEDRLSNLQAQLDKEVALGAGADQEKIDALKEMIAKEEQALEDAISDQEGKRDDEVKDVTDTLNEKIAELEAELEKEKTAYDESVRDKQSSYEEDIQNFTDAQERKLNELESKLEDERNIREMYAEDFKRVGDRVVEDDITRLKRKHGEEMAELEANHIRAVAKVTATGFESGVGFTQGWTQGFDTGYPQVQERINQMEDDFNRMSSPEMGWWGGPKWWETGGAGGGGGGSAGQHGGVFAQPTIIGEKNYPEIVLPLGEPARMAQILESVGKGQGEVTQNFYITVKRESDVDLIMERAAFNMNK